ncbi:MULTISPECIES: alanine--glyoxylate aminotransferase family protein [unclassified Staphylococcus]|uniref:pyridoxal-phosphate-dependent aminotransferase family protein n=1 Tax=unclassified Staphylococcus TaxID=91994 RepID=UPI0021D10BC0|nr:MULTISPECIES: alanine--glyoxylate aminotransferase family protein [unclassified Staphylococcus]UXR79133.1 alanine--glyoxylate aminotransferase family protein [Staphylococcus sp. IVB6227]UXR81770.1 alanine--glyoxylate aminotransferase family protein [Staphylococcus sp. IVB6214]
MYTHHSLLLTPGPTPVPNKIQHAMNLPMVGHRSSDFEAIAQLAFSGLKRVFGAPNDVIILTSSGTSALEASMRNLIDPDDHIVVIVSGAFGARFQQIAETYSHHLHVFNVEWGESFDTEAVLAFIQSIDHPVTAVFTQYCETSTSVLHPVAELGHALKQFNPDIYYIVDGVSCIGAVDVDMERDQIDMLVAGSQKAMMLPPGLAFVAYNDRAKRRFSQAKSPSFYLNLSKHLSSLEANTTPYTPNVPAFRGVVQYNEMIEEEGFQHVVKRHNVIRDALRQALKSLSLDLLVNDHAASPTVTAFVPKDHDELIYIKEQLSKEFNITIAGGQGKLKGHILRVGHMGFISPNDLLPFVSSLEMILSTYRKENYIGKGTKVFLEVIYHEL